MAIKWSPGCGCCDGATTEGCGEATIGFTPTTDEDRNGPYNDWQSFTEYLQGDRIGHIDINEGRRYLWEAPQTLFSGSGWTAFEQSRYTRVKIVDQFDGVDEWGMIGGWSSLDADLVEQLLTTQTLRDGLGFFSKQNVLPDSENWKVSFFGGPVGNPQAIDPFPIGYRFRWFAQSSGSSIPSDYAFSEMEIVPEIDRPERTDLISPAGNQQMGSLDAKYRLGESSGAGDQVYDSTWRSSAEAFPSSMSRSLEPDGLHLLGEVIADEDTLQAIAVQQQISGNETDLFKCWVVSGDGVIVERGEEVVLDDIVYAATANSLSFGPGGSPDASEYVGHTVFIYSGTGSGQTREVKSYDPSSQKLTVTQPWDVQPFPFFSRFRLIAPVDPLAPKLSVGDGDVITLVDPSDPESANSWEVIASAEIAIVQNLYGATMYRSASIIGTGRKIGVMLYSGHGSGVDGASFFGASVSLARSVAKPECPVSLVSNACPCDAEDEKPIYASMTGGESAAEHVALVDAQQRQQIFEQQGIVEIDSHAAGLGTFGVQMIRSGLCSYRFFNMSVAGFVYTAPPGYFSNQITGAFNPDPIMVQELHFSGLAVLLEIKRLLGQRVQVKTTGGLVGNVADAPSFVLGPVLNGPLIIQGGSEADGASIKEALDYPNTWYGDGQEGVNEIQIGISGTVIEVVEEDLFSCGGFAIQGTLDTLDPFRNTLPYQSVLGTTWSVQS